MRVELRDINGMSYTIATKNGKLLAEWFSEYLPLIYEAAKLYIPWQITVWAIDQSEAEHFDAMRAGRFDLSMTDSTSFAKLEEMFHHARWFAEQREARDKK